MSKKGKNIKFIVSIVTAIVIMVGSLTMVGISYAWFSDTAKTEVSTIELSTASCFVLSFDFGENPEDKYTGQFGFRNAQGNNHLVTSEFATKNLGYASGTTNYISYMLDKAFEVGTQFTMDTEDKYVEFNVAISSVVVTLKQEGDNPDITLMNLTDEDLIRYGFTWYIRIGNEIYTPYRGHKVYQTIPSTNNILPLYNDSVAVKWDTTPTKENITHFKANNATANLFIVFCPEKAYWYQYGENTQDGKSKEDWELNIDEIYSQDEINKITHLSSYPALTGSTYSDASYRGADFKFDVTVTVVNVEG